MDNKTDENLQEAFAGESQANRKYLFFAEKADKEGYPQVARLFRAAAEAETVHAKNHLNVLNGVGSTEENLIAASEGEHHEFTAMYPPFIEEAEKEGNAKAKRTFEYANKVEEVHHGLFEEALKAVKEGAEIKEEPYYVCPVCGYTVAGEAPEKCPVCGAPAKSFKKID
jgi:rubrerythrin